MDTTELTAQYPEQVASLQQEAVAAAMQGHAEALASAKAEAVEGVLALAGVVCDETTAEKLRAVVASGMTPAMLQTAKELFAAKAPAAPAPQAPAEKADARQAILDGLKAATPAPVSGEAPKPADEAEMIRRIGKM